MPEIETPSPKKITKITTTTTTENTDAEIAPFYKGEWWEVIDRIEWNGRDHKVRVYRADDHWDNDSSPEGNVIESRFDEEFIRKKWGGGRYNLWLYGPPAGTKVVRRPFRLFLEGAPKYSAGSNPTGGDDSALRMILAELLTEFRASRGTGTTTDAMKGALELQAAALRSGVETVRQLGPATPAPAVKSTLETAMEKFMEVQLMRMMNGDQDPLQKAFQEAMIKRLTDPADPIMAFERMASVVKTITGGGGKTDFGAVAASFVQTLPTIIEKGFDGVREYRLATEATERTMRLQTGHGLGTGDVIDATPRENPPPAATVPRPAAAPNPQVVEVQGPSVEWVQLKIVEAIEKHPETTGEDLYDFLNAVSNELNDQLGVQTPESLMGIFKGQPILAKVAGNPRLPKIIEQYLAYFKEQAAARPA